MAPEVNLWPLRGRSMQDRESELRRTPLLRTRVNKVGGCPRLRYAVRSNWRTRRRPQMHAAWYERCGPANEVLSVGEMEAPRPGPGEVLVRLRARDPPQRWRGDYRGGRRRDAPLPHRRAGVGMAAQSGRPFGTAAEYVA